MYLGMSYSIHRVPLTNVMVIAADAGFCRQVPARRGRSFETKNCNFIDDCVIDYYIWL